MLSTVKFPFPITADMGLRKGLGNGLGFNQPRIVKGYEPFHRPWMVFLHIAPGRGKSGFCYNTYIFTKITYTTELGKITKMLI